MFISLYKTFLTFCRGRWCWRSWGSYSSFRRWGSIWAFLSRHFVDSILSFQDTITSIWYHILFWGNLCQIKLTIPLDCVYNNLSVYWYYRKRNSWYIFITSQKAYISIYFSMIHDKHICNTTLLFLQNILIFHSKSKPWAVII